jgi:hypothetical protein
MEVYMKYYSEEDMTDIRAAFEDKVLIWPEVTTRKMFGCPCYKARNKLFAFLVTDGVVLTKLSEAEWGALSDKYHIEPFQAGKRTVKHWPRVTVENIDELDQIFEYAKKSYNNVLAER